MKKLEKYDLCIICKKEMQPYSEGEKEFFKLFGEHMECSISRYSLLTGHYDEKKD